MTRRMACLVYLALFDVSRPAHADDRLDARAIIDTAIEFAGGRDALARYERPFVRSVKVTIVGGRGPAEQESKVTTLFPDKFRTRQPLAGGGVVEIVVDGEKGWRKTTSGNGTVRTTAVGETAFPAYPKRLYGEWLSTLLPLDDDAFHLSTAEEIVIDGRPAMGVNIAHEGRPDVQLYFDKETFSLVKLAHKTGGDICEEYFDDHTEVDGLVYAKREAYYRNGVKIAEWRITELKFLDEAEEKTFREP